jgi:hypothetical protein
MRPVQPPNRLPVPGSRSQLPARRDAPARAEGGTDPACVPPTRAPAHGDQPVSPVEGVAPYGAHPLSQRVPFSTRPGGDSHGPASGGEATRAVTAYRRWTELDPQADPLTGLFLNRRM